MTNRSRLTGFWYVLPALAFVILFTAWPFLQMVWISLNDWSLITPPTFVGFENYLDAFADSQFWISLRFTLKYTLLITPILMIGGYLISLLVTPNSGLSRLTRTVVFTPVVIGLGASSLLWYWLFSPNYGLINKFLVDLGFIDSPILWLGVDAEPQNRGVDEPEVGQELVDQPVVRAEQPVPEQGRGTQPDHHRGEDDGSGEPTEAAVRGDQQ